MVRSLNDTAIEWANKTWNPIVGCLNDCHYCYAAALCKRFAKPWGLDPEDPFKPVFYPGRLNAPLKLKRPSKIFMMSMGELWGPWVPREWQIDILDVVREASQHTFLNLTKSLAGAIMHEAQHPFPENMWLGVSVDDNNRLFSMDNLRFNIDHPKRFVSFEPLLGDVASDPGFSLEGISWVIIGAQTGPRSVEPEAGWIASIMYQATCRRIPIFVKDNVTWRPAWPKPQEFPEGMP